MRVILISGEPAFRFGFRSVVQTSGDLELVAEAADARGGFRAIDAHAPDVVVMDLALKGMNGTSATREVRRRSPGTRVLLLSSWPRERDVLEGFAAGAAGFALKTESIETLIYAIRRVGHGNRYLTSEVRGLSGESSRAVQRSRTAGLAADVLDALSAREREVLDLVIKGWRNRDMARELCVSIKTIDTHRTRINRKLHCRSAVELIRFAADNGLLAASPTALALPEQRLIFVLMDDNPARREALLHDVVAHGYEQAQAPTAASALRELRQGAASSMFVIDGAVDPGAMGIRAMVSLPDSDEGEWFFAALDGTPALAAVPPPELAAPGSQAA